jgi:hypothetical protein
MEMAHSNTAFELIAPKRHMAGAKQMSNQPYPPNPNDPTIQNPRVMDGARWQARDTDQQQVESHTQSVEDGNLTRANLRYWIARVIYFVLGVMEVIMGLRFIFRLLGANQESSFVMVLYSLSHVFVSPFNGIFNDQAIGRTSVMELSTLTAMLVYALIAWGLVALSNVILAPSLTDEQRVIRSRRSRTTP